MQESPKTSFHSWCLAEKKACGIPWKIAWSSLYRQIAPSPCLPWLEQIGPNQSLSSQDLWGLWRREWSSSFLPLQCTPLLPSRSLTSCTQTSVTTFWWIFLRSSISFSLWPNYPCSDTTFILLVILKTFLKVISYLWATWTSSEL